MDNPLHHLLADSIAGAFALSAGLVAAAAIPDFGDCRGGSAGIFEGACIFAGKDPWRTTIVFHRGLTFLFPLTKNKYNPGITLRTCL